MVSVIEIVLSTYNGSTYLRQQLDSLFNQSYKNIHIMIRDDGSVDATNSIIESYRLKFPGRISVFPCDSNLGSSASFLYLLARTTADYIMFCDQDDVWYQNKVLDTLSEMQKLQATYGVDVPFLVFTDLCVVDADMNVLEASLWHSQKLDPKISLDWRKLLAQNVVTGCTVMVNKYVRKLIDLHLGLNIVHDQYVSVLVSKYGRLSWLDEPTMCYRQHGANVVGAIKFDVRYLFAKIYNAAAIIRFLFRASKVFKGEVGFLRLIYYKVFINVGRFLD